MQLQPTVKFRGIEANAAFEEEIRRRISRLRTYYPAIIGCDVLVKLSDRHHLAGARFDVRIDLAVPGGHVLVSHVAGLRATAREREQERFRKGDELDPERRYGKVAVREAFEVARRRLQDFARKQRGTVKVHAGPPRGRVVRLGKVYGFIEAGDGREVYFNRKSVLGRGLKRLRVGSPVSFAEERGEKGPQASTVRVLR